MEAVWQELGNPALWKMTALAFLGSVFPVVLFNIDRHKILWTGLGGALGWLVYSLVLAGSGSAVAGSFCGAFAVNLYSEGMARVKETPASMFYVPGIFPLVPGITAYGTISLVAEGRYDAALQQGALTLGIGGGIAFGIMLSATLVRFVPLVKRRLRMTR